MGWLLFGLFAQLLGANIEGQARTTPALRPTSTTASGIWYLMGKGTSLATLVAFVIAFFVLPWWAVLVVFLSAFILQLLFVGWLRQFGAAPLISMFLMIVGACLTVFGLLHPEAATF
tara:strand:- start:39 stop:389 length:351 start_codon:yes stop_codon:yes gene_type:complete